MASTTSDRPTRPSFIQVIASALAAVSAAIVSSTFGVAGTLIGAAIASVVASVGSTLYLASLHSTNDQLRRLAGAARRASTAPTVPAIANPEPMRPSAPDLPAPEQVAPRTGDALVPSAGRQLPSDSVAQRFSWRSLRRGLPALRRRWFAVAGLAVAVFAIAIGALTAIEAGADEPVASLFGHNGSGTSLGHVLSPEKSPAPSHSPTPAPSPTPSGSPSPAATPSGNPSPAPSSAVVPGESPAPGVPSPLPSEAPGVPVPSGSASPAGR